MASSQPSRFFASPSLSLSLLLLSLAAEGCRTAGPASGPTDTGGTTAEACKTALFCDDFEGGTPGQAPGGSWQTQQNFGTVTIDDSQHRSGSKSVKFTTQAKDGIKTAFMRLASAPVFPVAAQRLYGRMMFRLDSAPTTSVHWTMIQGTGVIPGQTYHAMYRYGGQHPITNGSAFVGSQWMANYETPDSYGGNGPGSDCWFHANKTVAPTGAWSCAEWKFESATNQMRFWLDGKPIDDLSVDGVGQGCVNQPAAYPWTAPTFDRLDLGWESYQTDAERTLWIDDVVISLQPIGCP